MRTLTIGGTHIELVRGDGTRLVTWFMDGVSRIAYSSVATNAAFRLVGKGDLDGDRHGDLLMVNPSTREILMLVSTGSNFTSATLPLVPQSGSDLWDVQFQ